MYLWPTTRSFCSVFSASVLAVSLLIGAGCSFETTASGLECTQEGSTRNGEICRNGFWRLGDDGGLDAVQANNSNPEDSGLPDAPVDSGEADAEHDATDCTPSNGGVEICDGVDNDCDGQVDGDNADDAQTFYRDADGDGFGDPADAVVACSAPSPDYIADAGDCDDTVDSTNPDAPEVCDGNVDNNCDQTIDEGCRCAAGQTRECGTNTGICQTGTQACVDGSWGDCQNETKPETEVCDGVDNDCDGQIDNGFGNKGARCHLGQGACQASGVYVCTQDGSGTECNATPRSPGNEICDGIDNDCNGLTDDGFSNKGMACSVGQGECAASGAYVCTADGSTTECDATPGSPSAEVCDGLDNDCDGVVDDGFPNKGAACTAGQGACSATGVYVCSQNGSSTECDATPGPPAASETCGDGVDNNCDGRVDEGCNCNFNGDSDGVCASGTLAPTGRCQAPANYEAQESSCDGLDNDCDGNVDENLKSYLYIDADGDGYGDGGQANGTMVCPNTTGYVGQYGDCDDGDPWTYPGAPEICDDKDNNCNGRQFDNRDSGYSDASTWCSNHFGTTANLMCDNDGPGGALCCEYDGDANTTYECDFETICRDGVDDDGDGAADCADTDCDGLSCAPGKTCQFGTCQTI